LNGGPRRWPAKHQEAAITFNLAGVKTSDDLSEVTSAAPRRIRVFFINDTARNGGPGRSLYYILKFIDPRVIYRTVMLPREGIIGRLLAAGVPNQTGAGERPCSKGEAADRSVADRVVFEPHFVENPYEPLSRPMERADLDASIWLRAARLVGNIGRGTFAFCRLWSLIRRGQFDLIYCNGTTAVFAGGLLAFFTGIPALWHVRYTSIPKGSAWLHSRLASSKRVKSIVCVSKAAAALFPAELQKVRIIHNGIDVDEFSRESTRRSLRSELGIGSETIVFGSHGRILPRKGYAEMVRGASLALSMMSERERDLCEFVIVGDTPEDIAPDHLAECRALAVTLGVADKVTFLGFRADVRPYIADFDVGVVPSVYPDPLPRAVLEIMAFGIPVIAIDVGGVGEMIDHDSTGTMIGPSPPVIDKLAEQFVRYLRGPGLRDRQGLAARDRVQTQFDARSLAKEIQNEIVAAARPPAW
jgi:glycosyltransferase involved in cell wall biosynthesis